MADTRRTWAQLAVLFADNTAGAISAQDLRDGFASLEPHSAAAAPTVSDDDTSGFDTDHAWIDTSTTPDSLYRCLSAATGAAVWAKVYPTTATVAWGGITGTLADQTDLQTALDAKLAKSATVQSYAGNRTLDADNAGAYVRITAAGTVTLPDSLATGFQCVIVNATASDTVALSAATTLTIPTGFDAEVVNRRSVTVIHVGSNVWEAHGALVETP